jgi:hypothetical protein
MRSPTAIGRYDGGAMSARDDQPITVPPPDGEDDAYNATTKVGAMPEEMMAKLRAEGLLPPEVDEPPAVPSSKSRRFADPVPPPRDDAPVAVLYSSTPPADHESPPSAPIPAVPPPPSFLAEPEPPAPPAPLAFEPPAPAPLAPSQPSQPPVVAVEPADPVVQRETQAFGGRFTRGQLMIGLIAVLGALVAFAFLMALMSQRR